MRSTVGISAVHGGEDVKAVAAVAAAVVPGAPADPPLLTGLAQWAHSLWQPTVPIEMAVLAVCVLAYFMFSGRYGRRYRPLLAAHQPPVSQSREARGRRAFALSPKNGWGR